MRPSRGKKSEHILVSVLMPAFRALHTIAKAVASVRAQTCADWELLIIADDEIDYRAEIGGAACCDERIRFLHTRVPASGVSAALNVGRRSARGRLVTRLDADDWYEPERLAILAPLALRRGVAGDNAIVYDAVRNREFGPWLRSDRSLVELDPFNLMVSPIPFLLVFRRDILPEWDEDLGFAEDVLFNARAFEHVAAVPVVTRCLWHYRVHRGSLSAAVAVGEIADKVYAQLLDECEAGRARLHDPQLQPILRAVLVRKRQLNRVFCVARAGDQDLSFQEFILERAAEYCDC